MTSAGISSCIHQAVVLSTCLLILAPGGEAAGAPGLPAAEDSPVQDYLEAIGALEQSEGPYAAGMSELFNSLGQIYQRQNRHDLALEAFQRAAHLMRADHGLFTPLLIPLHESMLKSHVANGRVRDVDDALQSLVYLKEKCYGRDARALLPTLKRLAEWNMKLFRHLVGFEESGGLDVANPFQTREERGLEAFGRLLQAQKAFIRSIGILADREEIVVEELLGLETRLVETYFYQAWHDEILYDPQNFGAEQGVRPSERERRRQRRVASSAFEQGREAYHRKLNYVMSSPQGNAKDYVEALLELGDWYLLFGSQGAARGYYQEAASFLESLELPRERIDKVLNPKVPVVIPAFTAPASGLGPRGEEDDEAYLEVEFSLDGNGKARGIHIAQGPGANPSRHEQEAIHQLRSTRFRPRIAEERGTGEQLAAKIRYYLCRNC